MREDPPNLRQEPHVQHAIRFVEDQHLEMIEPGVTRAHVVHQSARRRDNDVHAAAKRMFLWPHTDAAKDRRACDRCVNGKGVQILHNLRSQLARRRQHQRTRRTARLVDETMHDWKEKSGGLAAAGLRRGDHVPPFHRWRNGFGLNGVGRTKPSSLMPLRSDA